MKKLKSIVFLLLIVAAACQKNKQNFSRINNHIAYRLITFSNNDTKCRLLSVYEAAIEITGNHNELLYQSKYHEQYLFNNSQIDTLFNFMNVGDSVHFLLSGKFLQPYLDIPLNDTARYLAKVKIIREISPEELAAEADTKEFAELKRLKQYLDSLHIPVEEFSKGYFEQIYRKGTGDTLLYGDVAFLQYYGTFLNGKVFDSTATADNLFDYTCGVKGQVIPAFEKALYKKQAGDSFRLIIPSLYAFGEEGSSTLIVPPATTVIYYIKIDSVLKHNQLVKDSLQ